MSELEAFSRSIVKAAASKLSPIAFLGAQVRKMEREDVDKLAIAYLFAQVRTRKRAEVLEIERDSTTIQAAIREKARYAKFGPASDPVKWEEWAALDENAAPAAEMRSRWESEFERREAIGRAHQERLNAITADFVESMHTEWTENLLRSTFALGDGTETTWGDATREQHLYRINMHKSHALAGIEGAARHQQAIDQLDATGCLTLGDAMAGTSPQLINGGYKPGAKR